MYAVSSNLGVGDSNPSEPASKISWLAHAKHGTSSRKIALGRIWEGRVPMALNVMFEDGNRLVQLSDGRISDDGNAIGFQIERTDGRSFPVWCSIPELNDIFSMLASLAKAAGEQRGAALPDFPDTQNYTTAIPALGVGFQAGSGSEDIRLLIRLHGFDVAFQFPRNRLADLADGLARTARTLSADPSKKN
jgi:hypothetical protein